MLYFSGLCVAMIGFLCVIVTEKLHINLYSFFPECYFYKYTGYFCFGCGSTRAIRSLLQGNVVKSLYYNADIGYICVIYLWFMISYSLERMTKGRTKCMKIKPIYGYLLISLSVVQCLLKNIMAFYFDIWLL